MMGRIIMGWKQLTLAIKITIAAIRLLGGKLDCSLTCL